jgi:hypothetical protein
MRGPESLEQDVRCLNDRVLMLEKELVRQRAVNEALCVYVEADMRMTWMDSALALRNVLKDASRTVGDS